MNTNDKILTGDKQAGSDLLMQTGLQLLPFIMNHIPQAVFWKDRHLVYLGCNQAFADDAGFSSPADVIGKTDFDMPWKEQAELYRADDQLVMENGAPKLNYEEPQSTPDASIIWLSTSKIPVFENGQVIAVLGMYEDVTERKRAEEAVHASEERFRRFTEATVEGLVFHENGRIIDVNPAALTIFGFSNATKLIGRNLLEFIVPESHQMVLQQLQLENVEPYEIQCIRSDGTIFPVETSTRAYRDGNRIIRASSIRDITERKAMEQELRDEQQRLQTILETINIPVIISRLTDSKVLYANQALADIGHIELNVLIGGRTVDYFADPADRDRVVQLLRQQGYISGFETQLRRGDGSLYWALLSARIVNYQNDTCVFTSYTDITARKEMEQEIQKAFERRGQQVQLSTQVSQSIASAASLEELYQRVVTQVKEQFGYYHTQLLRYDPDQDAVVLVTGYGTTGMEMLNAGHRMPMGAGLIGTAAATGATVLRPALENDSDWHANPLLPDTKGEIAVPIKLGEQILGVLDVQSNRTDALGPDDQLMLEGLCGQIAVAINSTRLQQEMAERLEEINRLYRAMSHEGWQSFREKDDVSTGFVFDQGGLRQATDTTLAEELFSKVPLTVPGGEVIGTLAVADDPQRPISSDEQEFLNQVSEQVALALENARLFEQTQSALATSQESKAKLSEALDIAKLANWEYDFENDQFAFNDQFYSIFHTTAEKVGGYKLSSAEYAQHFVHPDDASLVGEEIGKAIASTERHFSAKLEHRVLYEDGGLGYISVEVHVERDEEGRIVRWYGANQDITERKKAEEVIRLAQERAQIILESVTLPMVITRVSDNVLTFINQPATEVARVKYEEAINRPAPDFYYNVEDRTKFITELRANGRVFDLVVQLKRGDEPFWALLSARVFNYQNEPSILTTFMDITDRINAEESVARRASELQTVAEVSTTTATTLEPDYLLQSVVDLTKERFGLYHAHIYLADDTWQTLLLAAGAGEVGRQMVSDGWNIPLNHTSSIVAEAARSRKSVIANDVYRDQDAAFLSNKLLPDTRSEMAVPMIVGDQVLGVFDVQSDIAGRFTQEDANIYTTLAAQVGVALQNARLYVSQAATVAQLRELDRLKSSFLANMSHELRTPLNSILGFADVMLEELDGPLTDYMNNDLRLIQKNGQHLLHLINDVLDMAKIEAGRMNLNPEKFRVYEVLDEVISITSTMASEKNLSLFIDDASDPEAEIYADHTRLRQVMINLVNNSIKFTETGKIAVKVCPMEGARVLISVRDTGIGIPPDKLEAVFQEFTQVDTSSTRKVGGTGLGLPISRRLVEMHGGRLWAESTGVNGEGSTFYVELPLEARITEVIEKQAK